LTRFVVDASVVVKWFVPEVHAEAARNLLREDLALSSPDLVRAEIGNVLWKKWRRGELSSEVVEGVLRDLEGFTLEIETSEPLLRMAWDVARRFNRSFYDGLYVALAERTDCRLVTADRKLYNSLREGDLAERLIWVENFGPTQSRGGDT
jgi:predicted nucleic acid-binding protein